MQKVDYAKSHLIIHSYRLAGQTDRQTHTQRDSQKCDLNSGGIIMNSYWLGLVKRNEKQVFL